jgi:hypothetical protein
MDIYSWDFVDNILIGHGGTRNKQNLCVHWHWQWQLFVVWNGLAYQLNQFCILTVAAYHFSNLEKGDQFGDRMVTLDEG